jgi:uncharacterized membrane protein
MVKALAVAAVLWPITLGGAVVARAHDAVPAFAATIYLAGSRICHQRPERSFYSDGVKWPVCGRCSGLYIGGAIGALAAMSAWRRRAARRDQLVWLAAAAVPTALTVVLEWSGLAGVGNSARALAGIPLGAMIAVVIVQIAGGRDFSPAGSKDPATRQRQVN